jgi:tetratricopeptide (TPR) repeat protein
MPKAIKKKVTKKSRGKKEEDVKSLLAKVNETAARGGRPLAIMATVVAVVIVAAVGIYFYNQSRESRAVESQYDGYKYYYGLGGSQPVEAQRYALALESFQSAYGLDKTPLSLIYVADSQYAIGKYEDAVSTLKEFNRRFPDEEVFVPLSYYKMALANMRIGDNGAALKNLETLAEYKSGSLKDLALLEAAKLLEAMGRPAEARQKYETIVKNFPQSPFYDEASRKLAEEQKEAKGAKGKK